MAKDKRPMNRKQRRATLKAGSSNHRTSSNPADQIRKLFIEAAAHERARKVDDAVRAYKRILTLTTDHAEACNNLGRILQAQGKTEEASYYYARSLSLLPQLGEAIRRQAAAWPQRLSLDELIGTGLDKVAANPLLLNLLQSLPVRDIAFERLLTSMRRSLLLAAADRPAPDRQLSLACALAKQCFINEYVFAVTPEETGPIEHIRDAIAGALMSSAAIEPMQLA